MRPAFCRIAPLSLITLSAQIHLSEGASVLGCTANALAAGIAPGMFGLCTLQSSLISNCSSENTGGGCDGKEHAICLTYFVQNLCGLRAESDAIKFSHHALQCSQFGRGYFLLYCDWTSRLSDSHRGQRSHAVPSKLFSPRTLKSSHSAFSWAGRSDDV